MAQPQTLEGTGEELTFYLHQAPERRFRLIALDQPEVEVTSGMRPNNWFHATPEQRECALDAIAEMNRRLPILPPEAFERESLYADEEGL